MVPEPNSHSNGDTGGELSIRLDKVFKSFDGGSTFAVRDLTLSIKRGEFIVLLGESGCGKTTTLKMINRLVEPTRGLIEVSGVNVQSQDAVQLRRGIGYSFQGTGLFPHLTIADNIAIVPRLLKWSAEEITTRIDELLDLVHLEPKTFRDRMPSELSGGQRQRVGVARALAARSKIMLMDEPFGALDPLTRDAVQKQYLEIHHTLGLTTVMVTHDMTEALVMADRIAVMLGGSIVQLSTPTTILNSPSHDYVRTLMDKPKEQARVLQHLLERQ